MIHDKKDLETSYGMGFSMPFIFTPEGPKIRTGSIDRIKSHTSEWPTCHSIVHRYHTIGIVKRWHIFGKNSDKIQLYQLDPNHFIEESAKLGITRRTWILQEKGRGRIIGKWRRLPSCYLKQLRNWTPRQEKLIGGLTRREF